jgi:hypothetical protein
MLIMVVVAFALFARRRRRMRRMYWMQHRMMHGGPGPFPPGMSARTMRRLERHGPFGPMGPFGGWSRDDVDGMQPLDEPVAVTPPKPVARTETPMEALQRRYVEGALTVEEYEAELDRLLRSK